VSGLQNKEQLSGINCNIDADMVYILQILYSEIVREESTYFFLKKKQIKKLYVSQRG